MKISVDGLLGSAQKINNQRQFQDKEQREREVRLDSVNINSRINSRLDSIESEIRDIQTSLTRSQIIRDGLERLIDGSQNVQGILDQFTFNGTPVLRDFLAEDMNPDGFGNKLKSINESIEADTGRLRRLQTEVGNILASDLAGRSRAAALSVSIDSVNPAQISNLNPETVMKLIR